MKIWIIKTTYNNISQASALKYFLLDKKLTSCVQIIQIQSSYIWDNKIQDDNEFEVNIKTTKKNIKAVIKIIKNMHAYKIPQIVVMKVKSSKEYFNWHKSQIVET